MILNPVFTLKELIPSPASTTSLFQSLLHTATGPLCTETLTLPLKGPRESPSCSPLPTRQSAHDCMAFKALCNLNLRSCFNLTISSPLSQTVYLCVQHTTGTYSHPLLLAWNATPFLHLELLLLQVALSDTHPLIPTSGHHSLAALSGEGLLLIPLLNSKEEAADCSDSVHTWATFSGDALLAGL